MTQTYSNLFSEAVLNELHSQNIPLDEGSSSDSHSDYEHYRPLSIKHEIAYAEKEDYESAEKKLNELLNVHMVMSENVIYGSSDSDEECQVVQVSNASTDKELEPELMVYVNHHLPVIKTEDLEDEYIQNIVNRYKDKDQFSCIKTEVQNDIYVNPKPGCSYHHVDPENDLVQNGAHENSTPDVSHHDLDAANFVVSNDIYENPTPGCSHYNVAIGQEGPVVIKAETISPSSSWYEENNEVCTEDMIKREPDLDIEDCPCSDIENSPIEENNDSDVVKVPVPIQNVIKIKNYDDDDVDILETKEFMDTSENNLFTNDHSDEGHCAAESVESSLVPYSEVDLSVYGESLENLTSFYCHVNGLKNTPLHLNPEEYVEFCAKILQIKSNHFSLIGEVKRGHLVKFEHLAIWGINMNREVEDLMKDVIPDGYTADEAKKFVLKMMNSQIRYRQRLADKNEENIYIHKYKYFCLACDRRDDNLTWLVAHLCRDTSEMIYMCCFCGFIFFNNVCSLIYHVILDNLERPKNMYCVECNGFYPSLVNHLMDTEGSWKVQCNQCDFISLSQCSHLIHRRYHSMQRHYLCPECGAYFIFYEHLERHLKNACFFNAKHIRYICPICAIIFKDKEFLQQHLYSFHHQRLLKCIQCHSLFISRFQYIEHRAQEHPESPCTYQICHTCALCPGREFKSSIAQEHMKIHSNDPLNLIVIYICKCNYYTIHKHKFIEHKKSSCNETPSFGKWEKAHEMKICGNCHDIHFVNISQPFECEYCEVQKNPTLTKSYQCKVCKLLISYTWDAVIQHFFIYHPSISVHNHTTCVISIIVTPNNCWVPVSSNKFLQIKPLNNPTKNTLSTVPVIQPTPLFVVCENSAPVLQIHDFNNSSSDQTKVGPIPKRKTVNKRIVKQPTKRKLQSEKTKFYNSLSHFMASISATPNISKKKKASKKTLINKSNVPLIQEGIVDESVKRLKQDTVPVEVCSRDPLSTDDFSENSNILKVNTTISSPNNLCISSVEKSPTFQSISAVAENSEHQLPIYVGDLQCSGNVLLRKLADQSGLQSTDNVCSHSKIDDCFKECVEINDKVFFKKENDFNAKETISNLDLEHTTTNSPSESFIKTDCVMNAATTKTCFDCKKCDFKCHETLQLVRHFISVHHVQNTVQCMECGDCFGNLKSKMKHLRSAHKINTKCYLEPDVNRLDDHKSKFKCPVCMRGFSNDQDKNLHLRCHGMAYLQLIKSNSKEI